MLMLGTSLFAQNHWIPDESIYPNNMSVIAVISLDGKEQKNESLEVAAFCNDELRGSRKVQYISKYDRYFAFLTVYGNDRDVLTFKIFDHELNSEIDYYENGTTLTFKTDNTIGSIVEPQMINFVSEDYKAFIGNGSWNDPSNWKDEQIPTTTDKVIINGMAIIPEGVRIMIDCMIINKNYSLSIENDAVLSVLSTLMNKNVDALIINDGGQIFQDNDSVAATFNKKIINPFKEWGNLDNSGWHFLSSPMINNKINSFIPSYGDYDLYRYDGTVDTQWVNYKNHLHDDFETEFVNGVGYLVAYETDTIASLKGLLFNDKDFDFKLSFNENNNWANFTLIGNPFPFNISWERINPGEIINAYASVNPETGAYIYKKEGMIKVGEGVMIYSTGRNAHLNYSHNSKTRSHNKSNYINVIASGNNGSDNIIINFDENEEKAFPKLKNFNDEIANIYLKASDIQCAIANCSYDTKEIPLYFDAKKMGNYTLSFDLQGEFDNIYLIDRKTGREININTEKQYTFMSGQDDRHDRFIIRMGEMKEDSSNDNNFVYIENDNIIINDIHGDVTINIYDLTGRQLTTTKETCISAAGISTGVYLIQKIDDKGVKVQKLTIEK